jgi:curved DNA-binding protein
VQIDKDYYQILGVRSSASADELKAAFRTLARRYHPDVNPNPEAEAQFKDVNEAYQVLSDPDSRARYDALRGSSWRQYFDPSTASEPQTRAGQTPDEGNTIFDEFRDLSSFFKSYFGEGSASRRADPQPDGIERFRVELTLENAYHGGLVNVKIGGKDYPIRFKPGIRDGQHLRIKGKNGESDIILTIILKEHPTFVRKGSDLYLNLPVDPATAVLGGQVLVPTLDKPVRCPIPAGSQHGHTLRLRDKGMPIYENPQHYGSLYVKLQIEIPTQLTQRERELYEQLAKLRVA